jgi:hypothetical protein
MTASGPAYGASSGLTLPIPDSTRPIPPHKHPS